MSLFLRVFLPTLLEYKDMMTYCRTVSEGFPTYSLSSDRYKIHNCTALRNKPLYSVLNRVVDSHT